jgi:hypothetical protein
MMTLLCSSHCYIWRELPMLSLEYSIDCTSCTFVERLIMDMITGVMRSY